jgi:hypothetical protein
MAGLPKDTLERIGRQRSDGNRFHSLVIGDCYMTELKSLFDQECPTHAAVRFVN